MFGISSMKLLFCPLVLLQIYIVTVKAGPQCLACDDVVSAKECGRVLTCNDHEQCYVQRFIASNLRQYFKLGCIDRNVCAHKQSALYGFGFMGIGKRELPQTEAVSEYAHVQTHAHRSVQSRDVEEDMVLCLECCDGDDCNGGDLCGSPPSTFLRCFDCHGLERPHDCDKISECGRDDLCYVHIQPNHVTKELRYDLQCKPKKICDLFGQTFNNLGCTTCCPDAYCNYAACGNWTWSDNTTTTMLVPTHPATTHTVMSPTTQTIPTTTVQTTTTPPPPPPQVTIEGPTVGNYSKPISLLCKSDQIGDVYQWLYNGSPALPLDVTGYDNGLLRIERLDLKTNGNYTCLVFVNGVVGSNMTRITIQAEKPTNVTLLHSLSNGILSLKCESNGFPVPVFDWSFSGNTNTHIPGGVEYSLDRSVAVISNYKPSVDDGTYTCEARNIFGSARTSVVIP